MPIAPRLAQLAFVLAALPACGDDGGSTTDVDAAVTTDGTPAIDAPSGARTLASCTTTIAADAPDFYKRYFKCVTVTKTATGVTVRTEDLPPHLSGYYPAADPNYTPFDTRGGSYHKNPNSIAAQDLSITIPDSPAASGAAINASTVDGQANTTNTEYRLGPAGVAIDSVILFSGTAAPGDNIAQERFTFDSYEGHPENSGTYHYHSPTPGPLEALQAEGFVTTTTPGSAEIELYGILCDGTVVLGCKELDGTAPAGALDAQGGHVGDIKAGGTTFFTGRYHTHVCATGHQYTPEIHYYATCVR